MNRFISMIKYGLSNTKLGLRIFKRKWHKRNLHNDTSAGNIFPIDKVFVGNKTYGRLIVESFGDNDACLKIGNWCSITTDTKFLLGGEHDYKRISTFPIEKYMLGERPHILSKGDIVIDDDVWIGYGCIILSGVHIGQGAVVAAGSVVNKDIPPYAIYAGGKVVKYRFDEEQIERLLKIDFGKITDEYVRNNKEMFTGNLNTDDVERILSV